MENNTIDKLDIYSLKLGTIIGEKIIRVTKYHKSTITVIERQSVITTPKRYKDICIENIFIINKI